MATTTSSTCQRYITQRPLRFWYALCLSLAWVITVDGVSPPRVQDESAGRKEISALISQLGDDDFQVRELAERRILEIGAATIVELKNARLLGDSEIRLRARRLLVRVLRADYQQRIDRFIGSTDPEDSFGLNGWREFSSIAGHDQSARLLFVSMQQAEQDVFLAWNDDRQAFETAARAVMSDIGKSTGPIILPTLACAILIKTMENKSFGNAIQSTSIASAVDIDNLVGSQEVIANRLDENRIVRVIHAGPYEAAFMRLIKGWLDSLPATTSGNTLKLRMVIRLALSDYGDFAAQTSVDQEIAADLRGEAIALVARSRQLKYIETIEPLLSDETLVGEFPAGYKQNRIIRVEIRDIALAALVYISGQAFSEFGFEYFQGLDDQFIVLSQAGFETTDSQHSAIAKWRSVQEKTVN